MNTSDSFRFAGRLAKRLRVFTACLLACLFCRAGLAQTPLLPQWLYSPITQSGCVSYSPDGTLLAYSGATGIQIYSTSTNNLVRCIAAANPVNALAFSPDGKTLAAGNGDEIDLWSVATGTLARSMTVSSQIISGLAFSPDGSTLAVCGNSTAGPTSAPVGAIELWSVSKGSTLASVATQFITLTGLSYSPDGTKLALCGYGESNAILQLLDAKTATVSSSLITGTFQLSAIAFAPNGLSVAAGGTQNDALTHTNTGVLQIWSLTTGAVSSTLATELTDVSSLKFSADGTMLADGGAGASLDTGAAELWTVSTGALVDTLTSPSKAAVTSVSFAPNGKSLATGATGQAGANGPPFAEIDLWNLTSKNLITTIDPEAYSSAVGIALSPDGATIASAGVSLDVSSNASANWIGLWNSATGSLVSSLTPSGTPSAVAFSPDGTMLADCGALTAAGAGGLLEITRLSTGKTIKSFPTAADTLLSVAFSPDNTLIADGGYANGKSARTGVLEICEVSTGKVKVSLPTGVTQGVAAVAFSPDGTMLAACGYKYTGLGYAYGILELWNVSTGNLIASLETGILYLNCVAFSADGKWLADGGQRYIGSTNSFDSGLEVWQVSTGNRLATLPVTSGSMSVNSVAFSPDGTVLFAGTTTSLQAFTTTDYSLLNSFTGTGVQSMAVSPSGKQLILLTPQSQLEAAANPYDVFLPISGLTLNPGTATGGISSKATVTLSQAAPAGGLSVIVTSNSAAATVPGSVTVAAGATTATFTVTTLGVKTKTTAAITVASGSYSKTTSLTINPASFSSMTLNPNSVTGGSSSTGTVTLTGSAPTGGIVLTLKSNNMTVVVPNSVTISAGQSQATFTVTTSPVVAQSSVTITAAAGSVSKQAILTVTLPTVSAVSVSPEEVTGGTAVTGSMTLTGPAPKNGIKVSLSTNSSSATAPSSVLVAAGATTATFIVKTLPVSTQKVVSITAKFGGSSQSAGITIDPPSLSSLMLNPTAIKGGKTSIATVTIGSPAPSGGLVISLSSNLTSATVPKTVTIPAGKTSATFKVNTKPVKAAVTATITAAFGVGSLSAALSLS